MRDSLEFCFPARVRGLSVYFHTVWRKMVAQRVVKLSLVSVCFVFVRLWRSFYMLAVRRGYVCSESL